MDVLDDNFALGCGPGTEYLHTFECMLERTNAITNVVLPITFVLAYPTLFAEGLDVRIFRVLGLPCAEIPRYEGTQGWS